MLWSNINDPSVRYDQLDDQLQAGPDELDNELELLRMH